jgi:hypothetical protein
MLLSAVGFGVNKEYNGVNWAINAARDGLKYGVFTAKVDATAGSTPKVITRDVATGMAFNTLVGIQKVTYAALIGDYIDGTGNVVSGYGKTLNGLNTNGTLAASVFNLKEQSGRITYIPAKAAFKVVQSATILTMMLLPPPMTFTAMPPTSGHRAPRPSPRRPTSTASRSAMTQGTGAGLLQQD